MDWDRLLCDYRMPRKGGEPKPARRGPYRSPFEADYDRIVYAAPFRRLARKTQVHPMAANDHVHNRLTHSIEVASVGRSFARRLGEMLCRRDQIEREQVDDLSQILQAACLVHDIGNPPFGHAGEFAIRQWVRTHETMLFDQPGRAVSDGVRADWLRFEGNAQGFRLAARADNPQAGYMRLTFATLGAMIKYPWDSQDQRTVDAGDNAKFNVFATEKPLFDMLADRMGLRRADGSVARHPLSFLSEAADDICYRVLDLEDAVDMNILDDAAVREVFLQCLTNPDKDASLPELRSRVISELIDACWAVFEADYDTIMAGGRSDDLKAGLDASWARSLRTIKQLYNTIFANRAKVATELGAYETLGRIIETLSAATGELADAGDYDRTDFLTRRRLELAWGEAYARQHEAKTYEWWLHQVMDYVAGLTDNYARQLAREIAGV